MRAYALTARSNQLARDIAAELSLEMVRRDGIPDDAWLDPRIDAATRRFVQHLEPLPLDGGDVYLVARELSRTILRLMLDGLRGLAETGRLARLAAEKPDQTTEGGAS